MERESLVIVPVYNEEKTLVQFYENLRTYYWEDVLFVNDGSTDKSGVILSKFKNLNTYVLTQEKRRGYGEALLLGFDFALKNNYRKILTLDADLQHNPRWISRFLEALEEYQLVLGSRYIRINNYLSIPRERLLINRYISFLLKELFNVRFTDPFCGFRAYGEKFLRRTSLEEKSYGLALEIPLEAVRLGISFKELPIEALYFKPAKEFLDGLDNPQNRFLYYLNIISKFRRKLYEKEVPFWKPLS